MQTNSSSKTTILTLATIAVLVMGPSDAAADVLFADDFDTSSSDVNVDLGTRQSGSFATSTYRYYFGSSNSISSNQLRTTNSGFFNDADFTAALTDSAVTGFSLSFDAAVSGANSWSSPFLSTHDTFASDDRGGTRFGLLIFTAGNVTAYRDDAGGQGTVSVTAAALATALGSWDVTSMNSYSLVATKTTATTGTYDLWINGTEALSDVAYAFGDGGANNGEINFEIRDLSGSVIGHYDNLKLETSGASSSDPKLDGFSYDPSTGDSEVSIAGAPGARYKLLEAAELDFSTPDQDPVPLTGVTPPATQDGNVVVTDSSGNATVQFNLGTAKDATFVRAKAAP